jgi:hypothetical protein
MVEALLELDTLTIQKKFRRRHSTGAALRPPQSTTP